MPTLLFDSLEMELPRDRQLLNEVMNHSGLARHPNEWWHFSYGDQLWQGLAIRNLRFMVELNNYVYFVSEWECSFKSISKYFRRILVIIKK